MHYNFASMTLFSIARKERCAAQTVCNAVDIEDVIKGRLYWFQFGIHNLRIKKQRQEKTPQKCFMVSHSPSE